MVLVVLFLGTVTFFYIYFIIYIHDQSLLIGSYLTLRDVCLIFGNANVGMLIVLTDLLYHKEKTKKNSHWLVAM